MQSNEEINTANLKQYLLGNLATTEIEAIDLRIISEESLEDELLWAESELMEDFLEKTLSPRETELFGKNFLVSDERKAQLRQISVIRNYARNVALKGASEKVCGKAPESFFEKLRNLFSLNFKPASLVLALVVVGLFAAGIFYYTASNQTTSEREFAEINRKDLSNAAELKNLYAVNLMSGTYRDSSGAISKLPSEKLDDKVLFKLALPMAATVADTFKVELVKDQKVVFTLTNLRFYNNPNGQELRFFLPAPQLKKGEYQIKVAKESKKNSVFTYSFAVE